MNTLRSIFVFTLLLCFSFQINAQKGKLSEGYIRYSIEISGDPDIQMLSQSSSMSLYFKEGMTKTDLSMMAGIIRMQMTSDMDADKHMLLMNIPTVSEKTAVNIEGQNIWEALDLLGEEAMDDNENMAPKAEKNMEIRTTKKRKKIAKYKCKRVEIGDKDFPLVLYVAPKLDTDVPSHIESWFTEEELDGFPLGFELEIPELGKITIMAQEISKQNIHESLFEIPQDYEVKSFEEFQDEINSFLEDEDSAIGL